MERYDFESSVSEAIIDSLDDIIGDLDTYTEDELDNLDADDFRDEVWMDDAVTTCRCGTWEAEEHLCHNMDLLEEAMNETGDDFVNGWSAEHAESAIREYVFLRIYDKVFNEYLQERL